MKAKPHVDKPIPKSFESYEAAGEFWDSHDSADYPNDFETVKVQTDLRLRHLDVTLDPQTTRQLGRAARKRGVSVQTFTAQLLRDGLERAG